MRQRGYFLMAQLEKKSNYRGLGRLGPTVPIGRNRKTADRYGGSNGGKSSLRKCLPCSGKTTRNWRQHGNRRERWNNAAIAAWRDEENRRTEHRDERSVF